MAQQAIHRQDQVSKGRAFRIMAGEIENHVSEAVDEIDRSYKSLRLLKFSGAYVPALYKVDTSHWTVIYGVLQRRHVPLTISVQRHCREW